MRCEKSVADLWLLAAGELADEDAESLTAHAAGCERCNRRLAEANLVFRATGSESVRPVAPPPGCKAQLMARIAAARLPGRRWTGLAAAAVGGALVLGSLLGAGTAGWYAHERIAPAEERLRFELALVRKSNHKQERLLTRLGARLEQLEYDLERATLPATFGPGIGPGLERARAWRAFLQWTEESQPNSSARSNPRPSPGGLRPNLGTTAQVFCLESEGLCVLRAAGLPAPQSGQSYALWLTNVAGRYYLVGTFEVDSNGEASLLASAPVDVRDVARTVITLEPGEAGWRPAGSVVLVEQALVN